MNNLKAIEAVNKILNIDHELIIKFTRYSELRDIDKAEEDTTYSKIDELVQATFSCLDNQRNHEDLEIRNRAIREKFGTIDESVKVKADIVTEKVKAILRHLGIRMNVTEFEDRPSNFMEVLFEFTNDNSCYIKLIFDMDTDDYDLLEMLPTHTNFNEIKSFLRNTGDVQGLIYTFWSFNKHNINTSFSINDDRSF